MSVEKKHQFSTRLTGMAKEKPAKGRNVATRRFSPETGVNLGHLAGLVKCDPDNLRRLWLLTQYQAFKSEVNFADAFDILIEQFKANNNVTGTYWSLPCRQQVLGKMREIKIASFLSFWQMIQRETGFDIFNHAAHAPLTQLLFNDNDTQPLVGDIRVKLPLQEWQELEAAVAENRPLSCAISLPDKITNHYHQALAPGGSTPIHF